jgi:alkylated DNA nucleotide flippase Atl1
MGRVEALFIRHGRERAQVAAVACTAGLGIEGDAHANRISPRQILVTLRSELDALDIAPGALFENMVIVGVPARDLAPGAALVTAQGVEIRLTMYCEPCQRIADVVPSLAAMLERRGVLGVIVKGGAIAQGDEVALVPGRYAPLPESVKERFGDAVRSIPAGRVARYRDIAIAMGVADSFVRAIPGYIRRHAGDGLPLHRIVGVKGNLPLIVFDQAARLKEDGIEVALDAVDLDRYLWR